MAQKIGSGGTTAEEGQVTQHLYLCKMEKLLFLFSFFLNLILYPLVGHSRLLYLFAHLSNLTLRSEREGRMKAEQDLVILDPPLALFMIDHYPKRRKKTISELVCALEAQEGKGLLKSYSKSSWNKRKLLFFNACTVMEMINLSLCAHENASR